MRVLFGVAGPSRNRVPAALSAVVVRPIKFTAGESASPHVRDR
jgi:hypothetical protein